MNDASYSLAAMARYFLKLGTIGFGGPVALVGYMYRDLGGRGHVASAICATQSADTAPRSTPIPQAMRSVVHA